MKFLSFLIAIMVLSLSCIPCGDAERFASGKEETTASSDPQATHSHSGDEQHDLCSPFCQCACCSLAYALPPPSTTMVKAIWSSQQFVSFVQHCPTGIALPVWQPPQLV